MGVHQIEMICINDEIIKLLSVKRCGLQPVGYGTTETNFPNKRNDGKLFTFYPKTHSRCSAGRACSVDN